MAIPKYVKEAFIESCIDTTFRIREDEYALRMSALADKIHAAMFPVLEQVKIMWDTIQRVTTELNDPFTKHNITFGSSNLGGTQTLFINNVEWVDKSFELDFVVVDPIKNIPIRDSSGTLKTKTKLTYYVENKKYQKWSAWSISELPEDLQKEVTQLAKTRLHIDEDITKLTDKLKLMLNACPSINRLAKDYPDLIKYLPENLRPSRGMIVYIPQEEILAEVEIAAKNVRHAARQRKNRKQKH